MAEEQLDIDGMIETLEVKIAAMQEAVASLRKVKDALGVAGIVGNVVSRGPAEISVDRFTGVSIVDAVEDYLNLVGRPARATSDILEALSKGGLQKVSPDSVTTLLTRSHNNEGPVVRAQKGHWGLAAWYPKRPPKIGRSPREVNEEERAAEIDEMVADEELRTKGEG